MALGLSPLGLAPLGLTTLGLSGNNTPASSGTKLSKALFPYNRQPPTGIWPTLTKGINNQLLYASPNPYHGVWSRRFGYVIPKLIQSSVYGTPVSDVIFGKAYKCTATNPLNYALCTAPSASGVGYSVMICFSTGNVGAIYPAISFGGTSGGGGWTVRANTSNVLELFYASVAAYTFTGLTLAANVQYAVVVTVTADGGTATPYIMRLDTRVISTVAGLTVGTQSAPLQTLSIGADSTNAAWNNPFNGVIGAFAVWERCLTATEAFSLVTNPYQIWDVPSPGRLLPSAAIATSISGGVGTSASGSILSSVSSLPSGVAGTNGVGALTLKVQTGALAGGVGTSASGSVTSDAIAPLASGIGTSASGSITFTASSTTSPSGAAGTSAAGTLTPSLQTGALSGGAGTSAAGAVIAKISTAILGALGTSASGAVIASIVAVSSGAVGTSGTGSLIASITDLPLGIAGTSASGSITPSVKTGALSGSVGTSASGSVMASVSSVPSGVVGTSSAGAPISKIQTGALSGDAGTSAAGTIGTFVGTIYAAGGASGTSAAGAITASVSSNVTLSGVVGTSASEAIATTVFPSLTGAAGTSASGTLIPKVVLTLVGVSGANAVSNTVVLSGYAVAGITATTQVGNVAEVIAANDSGESGTSETGSIVTTKGVRNYSASIQGIYMFGAVGSVMPVTEIMFGNIYDVAVYTLTLSEAA